MSEDKPLLKATARPAGTAERERKKAEKLARAKAYYDSVHKVQLIPVLEPRPEPPPPPPKLPKPKKIWDNSEELGVIVKSERLGIKVTAVTRDGCRCITLRECYFSKKTQEWAPSPNGITIPLKHPLQSPKNLEPGVPPDMVYPMGDLMELLPRAIEVASTMALSDPKKAVWKQPKIKTEDNKK